jgi:hypothetical protein
LSLLGGHALNDTVAQGQGARWTKEIRVRLLFPVSRFLSPFPYAWPVNQLQLATNQLQVLFSAFIG